MNTQPANELANDPWRPAFHLTAANGFINDPNGLIYIDERHHAFYQHNPHDVVHGPMHWGHAVSDDLVHWQELPIALYPDEIGQCFSGSAVETPDGEIALIYTAHLEKSNGNQLQTQCLVHANRALTEFTSAAGNPVLANNNLIKDFRDPKVFWHMPSEAWIMLITHGRQVGIYRSEDLLKWSLASEFGCGLGAPGEGPWECPDLVEVAFPNGNTRWALIVGVWSGAPGGGSGTQYFLGHFDGHQYTRDLSTADVHWLDHGRDCYAVQSFAGRDSQAPRVMAWASNWQYANDTPTTEFRGALTLPRDLELIDTASGYRLRQSVPSTVKDVFVLLESNEQPSSPAYRLSQELSLDPGQKIEIRLFAEEMPAFTIERAKNTNHWHLSIQRQALLTKATRIDAFGGTHTVELAEPLGNVLDMELFVDNGLVELFLGQGVDAATMCFYPADPVGAVSVTRSTAS